MRFLQSPIEYILFGAFILFLVLPMKIPGDVANLVDSPLGMIALFLITVALFVYVNPILGVLYIFVAYELLRRSSLISGKTAYIEYTPTQPKKDEQMRKMNPAKERTLEETVVEKMSPIGQSNLSEFVNTSFKPVSVKTFGASEF
jgi:energy-coupling factor transporter transmembrane protein EcfT